ncbi:MAG: aldehyde dehydrogenase family protein, partial [Gemmatimonadaceae bacterium]|nr:aldehyde dehydrogenase family protein [Gloeobacterales cyanobacterium ES-bin-141]
CALAIEESFERAGFEPGVFHTLLVGSDRTADVVADARVRAVTLTGSEPAGAAVAAIAGRHLKKTVLELGGSDPFIILASADLESAVSTAVKSRMLNNGQSCIAAKRFIVVESVADVFERRLVEQFEALRVGDPMHSDTDLGPLATPEILTTLERQVQTSLNQGARLLTGGHSIHENGLGGNFYAPTILTDIPFESPAYQEELFGPVAVLFRVADLDAAVQLANDTPFGLGASAWTTDARERDRVINELECGLVFINGMVKSDPRLPFGGTKRSGYGRELSSHGLLEFVNIKTVWTQ